MKLLETGESARMVFDGATQKELLDAASEWVDEDYLIKLHEAELPEDCVATSGEVRIVAPDTVISVPDYVQIIARQQQRARTLSKPALDRGTDTYLTVRTAELEDGTDVFGFIDNFGKAAWPTDRRLAVVPSIALLLSHTDGNATLTIQNRPNGERAWLDIDKTAKIIRNEEAAVSLGGLAVVEFGIGNLIEAANNAAQTVLGLGEQVRAKITQRRSTRATS